LDEMKASRVWLASTGKRQGRAVCGCYARCPWPAGELAALEERMEDTTRQQPAAWASLDFLIFPFDSCILSQPVFSPFDVCFLVKVSVFCSDDVLPPYYVNVL
jgi:hypothetical protein